VKTKTGLMRMRMPMTKTTKTTTKMRTDKDDNVDEDGEDQDQARIDEDEDKDNKDEDQAQTQPNANAAANPTMPALMLTTPTPMSMPTPTMPTPMVAATTTAIASGNGPNAPTKLVFLSSLQFSVADLPVFITLTIYVYVFKGFSVKGVPPTAGCSNSCEIVIYLMYLLFLSMKNQFLGSLPISAVWGCTDCRLYCEGLEMIPTGMGTALPYP
jgi:hypothetical protein